jgi:ankyrin repeat protein
MTAELVSVLGNTHPDTYVAYDGSTALHMACKGGHHKICELLLLHGADPSLRTEDGSTALLLASATGNPALIEIIYKLRPEDINACNEDGFTAMDIAKYYNHDHIVSFLESRGGSFSGIETPEVEEIAAGPSEKWGYGVFDL